MADFCRWDAEHASSILEEHAVGFGSFLAAPEHFDASAFGLSATEATLMDPQQRLLLECTAEALGDVPDSCR